MLAPRKTLWSTPREVMEVVLDWIPLTAEDIVCDVGCGDGRTLIQWATHYTSSQMRDDDDETDDNGSSTVPPLAPHFVGLDIDAERIQQARQAWETAVAQGHIDARLRAAFYCANAVEAVDLWKEATVLFLYLIPRGLRRIKALLVGADGKRMDHAVRIVTYMAPFPDETPWRQERVTVGHQPNAAWPLFAYRWKPLPRHPV
jgi:hypothetical protein